MTILFTTRLAMGNFIVEGNDGQTARDAYVESDGTQVLNSGYNVTRHSRVEVDFAFTKGNREDNDAPRRFPRKFRDNDEADDSRKSRSSKDFKGAKGPKSSRDSRSFKGDSHFQGKNRGGHERFDRSGGKKQRTNNRKFDNDND